MKINMYSIYDRKAKSYGQPFFAVNDECAQRIFVSSFSESSQVVLYPGDFDVCAVGSFDDSSGVVTANDIHNLAPATRLIPSHLRQFALDGSFSKKE